MLEIIFKTEPVKYIHTEFGDFQYKYVVDILKNLSSENERDVSLVVFLKEDENNLKQWLFKNKAIQYSQEYDAYWQGNNWYKFLNKITEHERVLDKLAE